MANNGFIQNEAHIYQAHDKATITSNILIEYPPNRVIDAERRKIL